MDKQIFEKNMVALKQHGSAFFVINSMAKQNVDLSSYCVETAKTNEPFITYSESENKILAYHSKYDPVKEAEKQVKAVYSGQNHVMLMGFGLGYAAQNLAENTDITRIDIVEPDKNIFYIALKTRDLSKLLNDKRVSLFVAMTPDEIGDVWATLIDWTTIGEFCVVDHPPTLVRFREYVERLLEKIRYLCNKSKGNLITLMYSGFEYHSHNFENLGKAFELPGVQRLFGKFVGVPAVLVAAGPSLDKNMDLLHKIKGKFPIVAVDTALRQLVTNGIKPDIVCAADSSYENSLDFVGVEDEKDVILAVEPMTHPDIFNVFNGQKMLMTFGGGLFPVYSEFREPVGTLVCWGSIATTVFDLVRKIGADPIIFLGLDLSFADGRLHARGSYSDDMLYERVNQYSSIEHETAEYINSRGKIVYNLSDGTKVYTDKSMNIYKDWFEDQFRQTDAEIINATEGGIVHKYVKRMTFSETIEKYIEKAVNVSEILTQAFNAPVKAEKEKLIRALEVIKSSILKYQSKTRRNLSIIARILKTHENTLYRDVAGKAKAECDDIMALHDTICRDAILYSWMSTHQAKFITKHSMEVARLKTEKNVTVGHWLKTVLEFFVAFDRFIEYQTPLINRAVSSMQTAKRSN